MVLSSSQRVTYLALTVTLYTWTIISPIFFKRTEQARENVNTGKLPRMTPCVSVGPKSILGNLVPVSVYSTVYSTKKILYKLGHYSQD